MRIALATCSTLPAWERDDLPFHAALRAHATVEHPVWDDPEVDWSRFDLVVIRTTWDYQQRREAFIAWATRVAACTRLQNPAPIVRWNTDKTYLRELEAVGIPIAPTTWFEVGEQPSLDHIAAQRGLTRGFLKPVIAANARGALRFDARDTTSLATAQQHLLEMIAVEPMMLQPYLPAVEREGELSLIYFDGVFSHAVRKIPVAGDFRTQDDHGARDQPLALADDAAALAKRTLAGFATLARERGWDPGLLYARIDMLRDESGQLVLNELEVVEPSLFFRHSPHAAERFAAAVLARC
jgi:glutathione synthase/RimK-type ligase-like ATP-grasp enzyme